MTLLLALALVVAVALLVHGLRTLVSHDGFGHRPLPRSHRDEQSLELRTWRG
ncbi:hypothetical protein [Solicola sp. PLA-1-18]|uniref:hypothetical protein n=1 Tax=Solicola sp. PLA-1-18 TaxID=3380532 RepID=UPI003B798E52